MVDGPYLSGELDKSEGGLDDSQGLLISSTNSYILGSVLPHFKSY